MEKTREYKYDNLKLILIFFVVFGHFLEYSNAKVLYKTIYLFHMPIFVYISGYFTKATKESIIQKVYIYIVWQTIYFLIDKFVLKQEVILNYFRNPIKILWYIYALAIWEFVVYINPLKEKVKVVPILCLSFALSLIVGYIDSIGNDFAFSRIITFFPYFLIGYYQKNKGFRLFQYDSNSKKDKIKIIVFLIIFIITSVYFVFNIKSKNERCFYGAFSYKNMGYTIGFKMMWILSGLSIMFFLCNIIPNKKIKILSKIGSNTLMIYLLHGIVIKIFGLYYKKIFMGNSVRDVLVSMIFSIILIIVFGNDYIKKLFFPLIHLELKSKSNE